MVKEAWNLRYVWALVLLATTSGCGILESGTNEPKRARLQVSESSTESLEVTTSLNFLVRSSEAITFEDLSVDTVSVPYDKEYDIREHLRFYVLATNIETETISFRMKVTIDEKTWYNEIKNLAPGETAQFVYRYSAPPLF